MFPFGSEIFGSESLIRLLDSEAKEDIQSLDELHEYPENWWITLLWLLIRQIITRTLPSLNEVIAVEAQVASKVGCLSEANLFFWTY